MKTKEQVEKEFRKDLNDLLLKYKAEIDTDDHYSGYPECGRDIKVIVSIPGDFDKTNGLTIQEYAEFDLGCHLSVD